MTWTGLNFAGLFFAVLLPFGSVSSPYAAERSASTKSDCAFTKKDPRFTKDERRKLHAYFGLPSIEVMHRNQRRSAVERDVIVGIVRLKLGGGVALVFQRDRKGVPWVDVHVMPLQYPSDGRKTYRAQLSEGDWQEIAANGRSLDVDYYEDRICVGGSIVTIEVADADGAVRNRVGEVCEGPGRTMFEQLEKAALYQFPECAALEPEAVGSAYAKFMDCHRVKGEKAVATELYNRLENSRFWEFRHSSTKDARALFADEMEVSWPGIGVIKDPVVAANFLVGEWLFEFRYQPESYEAQTQECVRVEGRVWVEYEGSDSWNRKRSEGYFDSLWRRGRDGLFRMSHFTTADMQSFGKARDKAAHSRLRFSCPSPYRQSQ